MLKTTSFRLRFYNCTPKLFCLKHNIWLIFFLRPLLVLDLRKPKPVPKKQGWPLTLNEAQRRREELNVSRRGEMESRLRFTFQCVNRSNAIAAQISGGTSPGGSAPAKQKKLFLTDGWTCAFTGICIYIFRINVTKQLPEEGFQKDLFCGIIDAKNIGLVTSIERIVEYVFMQALAFPSLEGDEEDVSCGLIKGQLLPGLRSFCSALRVCEQVCDHYNVFNDGCDMFEKIDQIEEVKDLSKNQEFCNQLEERVTNWIKGIMKILGESEQLRKENDHSGPQDELEYWKKRGAQFSQLLAHLQEKEVQFTLHCLFLANSKVMRDWKETDRKITFCYNEARDNSKFIQAMEHCCHSLYLDDPVCMKESILSLLQTVRLIYSVSQFYNTSERTSALMVKITNQMIETCKSYITCRCKETIWSQDRNLVRTKLSNCIKLNHIYHETYYTVREQPFLPNQTPFGFSENFVFGKFDTFCERLSKITSMFNLIDDYNHLFERRLEGLLLGEALEEASNLFEEAKKDILSKKYDYLDHRNADFNDDYDKFITKTDTLKDTIATLIETNFDTVWETPQCIRFLVRFEKVSEKIPLTKMDEKYLRIIRYVDKEVERVLKLFRKQRDDPPVSRNFPPMAGRVYWTRSLDCHISELVDAVCEHPVLGSLPPCRDLEHRFNHVMTVLHEYEDEIIAIWLDQDVSVADACLLQPLLSLQGDRIFVNLHPTIPLLIREAKLLAKLNIELPIVAATLMSRQDYFITIQDSLNHLIKMFLSTVRAVKLEVRPLFLPQLVRLTAMLKPGLTTINWTNQNWHKFYERCKQAIETFEVLVARIHDIYSNRILHVLMCMQEISLQVLPGDDEIWTVDEFLEKSEESCRKAAIELNRKSQMVSEAVEEVLNLVDKATETFKEIAGDDVVTLFDVSAKDQTASARKGGDTAGAGTSAAAGGASTSNAGGGGASGGQQQDWSILWSCFDNPLTLLATSESLPKGMQDMVCNAVVEMRRYYSRKVIDVLIKVIRAALDTIRRRFIADDDDTAIKKPVFALYAQLQIPNVVIKPNLEELQEILITAGKNITGIAKGVAQWTSGKENPQVSITPQPRVGRNHNTKRRKLYTLASEERPQMPHMLKSFYSAIMDNKEVAKALNLLSNCTKNIKPEIQTYIKRWKPYHFLWKNDRTTRQLMEFGLQEFESTLRCLAELDANLLIEPDMEVFACNHKIGQAMKKKYKKEMDYVYAVINEMDRKLDRPIRDLDDVRMIMETLSKIREQEVDMELRIDPIEEAFNVLTRYEVQVEREQFDLVDNLRSTFQNLLACALQAQVKLLEMQPSFQDDLKTNLDNFKQDKITYVNEYRTAGPMQPGLTPREASDRLILFQNRFEGMWRRLQTYQNRVSSYYDIPWNEVDIEEINNELMEFQNRCRKLPKGLKEWPAFHALKKTIDDFNDMCPLLELMANKAMKPRHWQRIMDVSNYIFEFDSEGFSLKNILEAPLLKHKEDIEDICISAMKEKDIEAKLKQVTNEWSVHELQFMSFNNRGELLLRGDTTAETIGQLEDSLMILGSLLSNRYNAPFRKQIQQWVYDLSNSNEILERWLLVQNMWVYLEAVFVGGDIAKQLPKEAKRFSKIDKSWQKIMQRAHETPGVVACCVGDDLLKQLLPHLQEQLEICQKSLSGYLERKRMMFPRFFFVSDPALLEILGQASDSHTIQNHLLSIFDNTRKVKFHDIEYNKMMAIISSEGEMIQLDRAIRAEGSVETWLTQLLVTAQQSLHSIIRTAYATINDPNFTLLGFLEKVPAQVGLLGIQMIWTRDAEMALMQARHERKVMSETNNKFLDILNTLIDQTTRNLTKMERTNFETLITIHVHQRDIFDILCRMNIKSANDFEWLKQCRFYFKEDLDKTWISVTDVTFTYQNEYLGCTDRLVITPLTDRCYITLAQALTLSMGGAPCGPAGTGKTETVKDMGKTLAKYVVVFNCSDQMDYRGLGRIYKGLAQSGSWGCFDEFNRIELPVLSVAAQQVAVVLTAKKEKKKSFIFTDGDTIEMNPEFGIFITMNPGYAGRKELPENLKIQFRTVAMMVPDRQIIIRVKLASCGFLENITLARKFYTLYKLCEEQLTKQVHYDFGLRNILSVLRTLGAAKRRNSKDSESTIVMRVLRDMNLSKLIDDDEPLFISLVSDLFPNQTLEKTNYPELEAAIAQQAEEANLVYHPPWVLKLIQLYETQNVRHGIMTLGPSGAGKTTCIHTLMKALTQMGDYHREMRMNPKAITAAQMFGRLDVATNDWTDGIFSALWRKTLKIKSGEHVWLVLDGPVDSIWIENLNSVLDDNKTLTLANGDRLTMAPTVKIIFEPHNIDNASPATVSRNGMVYMSSSGLDSRPIVQAWLKNRAPGEKTVFSDLFERTFVPVFSWGTQNLKLLMPVLQCNVVRQMLLILEGLVPVKKEDEQAVSMSSKDSQDEEAAEETLVEEKEDTCTPEHLHRLYIFALAWGLGAYLNTVDRVKMNQYVKETFPDLDFAKGTTSENSIFDFFVSATGSWQSWKTLVTPYMYPEVSTPDYLSILVPIVDNVRMDYLIGCIANQEKAVMLIGEQGTGKTVIMKNFMKKMNVETYMGRSFNFSSATSPYQFQRTIESYVEKRVGVTFGPPGGRKLIVFIDDINLPEINEWGDQVTNEIVRQSMDMKGFYSLEKPGDFTTVVDVQYVAAMGLPGGGRNDIPSRLKRQFCVFNCNIPDNDSIDKIFRVIGEGHYNAKRGFIPDVRNLVKKLIVITRYLWQRTREKLLPTPAKFHYVFSLRDLSRIWQGMVGTLSTVITSESVLMSLWKHECTRVFADRFTNFPDKEWFSSELSCLVRSELGENHVQMILPNPVFVDFMRDAPEPTGEEGEDADMELPKVYEPVTSHEVLRERLVMFLAQFNEMVRGSGMDLVFFPDAMLHLVKISRIIRHPRGNVMLVGVGGSGKQSLTKLASFIAGYKTFQIALTRSYNVANFLEDLKLLYRTCGVQGKGTTFLFTDMDIKEEGFLEYLNNILSSGVISNLFSRDEQAEIVQELTPIMKRENQRKTATPESVMEFFLARTCANLHVAFCFSPVGETFRARVQRFPALVSGCTIDWFQPWPKDALVSVSRHFLSDFEIECTPEVKEELVNALGSIQDVVAETSQEYFQRFRRATHVTPKSYLNFIAGYKNIYQQKQKELGDGVEKMDTGLEKLKEASASVEILKKDLVVMEEELVEASKKAESVLVEVTERAMQAEIVKNQVLIVKDKAEALVACIANEKALAEEKLEAAKPALEEAENALNTIKPAHIATVRKLGRPPHLIMRIMDCVLILFKRKLHPCIPDSGTPCPKPSWQESLKMMASATFLLQLQNYPKDTINDEMIDLLQPYFRMEDYNMDMARRVCGDVAGLLSWTKAMGFFHSVNKEVLPLKANLTMQEARLKLAMDDLAGAEDQLREREEALQAVKNQYDKAVGEKQRLTDAANACLRKMTAATALINGLSDEKVRWTNQSKEFKIQLGKLVGDVLLATGFLSYCGPYNQEFRANLIRTWMGILKQKTIPFTTGLNIINMLVDSSMVSEWTLQGLPNDELSVQNALIATKSSSYPLLIDPQTQGKLWIKSKEEQNELQITSLNHKYFRTHLEDALSLGRPLLIEDVGVELDPVIDNVLEKNFIKSGSIEKVLVGDKECDVMPGFMLYITTKLPNPPFSPEVSAKTSIIDFTVTMRGLEDQLLGRVILMEKSDLEAERVALFETVMQNQRNMKELEANLLYRLSSSQGSLVDDEALIEVLRVTKTTAEEVNEKLKIAEVTERKIMKAREEFRAVAARGSILYFLIVEMSNVNVMYQNSLKQFLVIFNNSITKSTKSNVTEERINIILRYLTYEVYKFTNRSLYERHKQLFTLMLAIKIDYHKGNISHEEFMAFIKGGASLDLNAVQPKPFRWILDITWLNLVEISKLETFVNVLELIELNEREWRTWYESEKPENEEIPCGYQTSLDGFRKLLLIRSWCPDRTISQAKKYIEESLGPEYSEMQILDLELTWSESEPRTPFVCLLSIGSDPTTQIAALAKQKGIPLKSVSMGQGQEFHARKMIMDSMANGGWVLLQNVHLSLPFCTEVIDMLVETEHIDNSFRMWVTTEPHSDFPIGLLQMAIKFTNEPPQGIRASLKRSYQAFTQDFLDYTAAPQWPTLLYTVAFLHTIVQERRKFGPLGWNVPYEFNAADFAASVQFVQNHLDEMDPKKGVSWQTLVYMIGEVQYGGRVTDDFDKRLLTTFTAVWFCEGLLSPSFEFYKGYKVPNTKNLQTFIDYINNLPAYDTPEVFGLHSNADITYQINSAKGILDTILSVQPKEGGGGGGETRESIVYQLADDMLRKLPPQYNAYEVRENLIRMGILLPMNIFLRQEIDRMQKVIKRVYNCLCDLKLAIDGTIVMSPALKESLDAMYDARIPESWMKISWESTTLGFWYTELLERNAQFRTWISTDRPKVFWMTGFFNPQGFLTAMRQEVTRAHKGWALDSVVLQNQITRYNKEDITEYPTEGVYVHGLFLEGASLDRRSGKLIESKMKVLYEQMPYIFSNKY
ncbi:axonemal, Dynein heavy chain 5 [Lucilia cuprina]|nr:axonemal, Dynein heavy chain 5 [Lucilia cuprina]